jgi:Na+/proline symporter
LSSSLLLSVFLVYTLFIFLICWYTSRRANDATFYIGNRQSPWYVVAYGMIGASLSGVTFLSEPGWVGDTQFSYMMVVFGYVVGYAVIALILLPLYYRLNLTSIYTYLDQRFGNYTYKTGASFFILSRGVGAALRIFLTVYVLDIFVFGPLGIPFLLVASVFVLLVLLYTFKGGIRTIVWTDTLQTTFMLLSVAVTIGLICKSLGWSFTGMLSNVWQSDYSAIMVTDWTDRRFFLKQFLGGIFITIAMTGLDQDMMQKNLSCRNLRDARKNMFTFSWILVAVNAMFLLLGAMLYFYAGANHIATTPSDSLFANVSIHYLGVFAGIVFLVGLVSAAYSSADGALTALTTSFCIDIIGLEKRILPAGRKRRIRYAVHFTFALLFLLLIMQFKQLNNKTIIDRFFTVAGYTYGPLLGLYGFGLFTRLKVRDRAIPFIAVVSPLITYLLDSHSVQWFGGYRFGFELLIVNGLITFAGLWLCRKPAYKFAP